MKHIKGKYIGNIYSLDDVDVSGKEGVWKTIKGRKVFIREGESLENALKRQVPGYSKLVALETLAKKGKTSLPLTKKQQKEKDKKDKELAKQSKASVRGQPKTLPQWKERARALKQALEYCRKRGDFTNDYPVSGHTRSGKPVKAHTRGKMKKKSSMLIQNEDEWAIVHLGRTEPYPTYKEYLEREKVKLIEKSSTIKKGTPERTELLRKLEDVATKITELESERFKDDFIYDFINSTELNDITLDFYDIKGDFTILHGPITRAGPFEYEKNGVKVIYYKDWDNIMEVHKKQKYYPLKASIDPGSHHAEILGYATNWEPHPETEQMFADIVLFKEIDEVTDLLNPEGGYQVSIGFKDRIENNVQIIEYIDHIAMSLRNKDTGRCLTAGGRSCYAKKKELNN